jgi:hypothetical protein
LCQLAEEERQSSQAILDKTLERHRRKKFLRAANDDFKALRCDAKAWREEMQGRELLGKTLAYGLARNNHARPIPGKGVGPEDRNG